MRDHQILIKAVAKGNQDAFKQLYNIFSDIVFNTALGYTQNKELAEEVTQDVFVSIYKNANQFKSKSKVSTWIYRITVNTALNAIKKRKKHLNLTDESAILNLPDFDHPGILMENKENAAALFKAIETLSNNQKTAFILSYIEDLPRQQVADIMEITLKATESLLQRAKVNLREKLKFLYANRRKTK